MQILLIPRVPDIHVVAKWMDARPQPIYVLDSVVIPAKDVRTGCLDASSDGFVSHGWREIISWLFTRAIITLRVANRDRGRKIRMRVTRMTMRVMCHCKGACHVFSEGRVRSALGLKNVFKEESCLICSGGNAYEKSTDKLSVKEFRDRFCIPNSVIVEFLNEGEDVVSTEKAEGRAITFSKNNLMPGFVPSSSIVQGIPYFFQRFHQPSSIPNIVRVLMGCSIINMLFNLDLTLLEVLFVYSLKKGKMTSLACPLTYPPFNGDGTAGFDEGRGEGTRGGPGRMGGIDAKERHYATLLTARNLMAIVRESQEYVVNILPRKAAKGGSAGEHYVLKDLLSIRSAASPPKKAPAKKKEAVKNGKGVKEPTPPKEFVLTAYYSCGGGNNKGAL
ncbi:hypothetical protein CK203_099350 [Vitis vinifera]|uniref:Uncharacterized protein n=1 Tax=Vitis vinifera TaxID=29760 RepID=A0A438DF13_VITVI|nr:hypothetical protein CK203_099350 [Vitis vinifera]